MAKKFLWGCGGFCALLVLVVAAIVCIGYAQPVDHVAAARARFRAPAAEVWKRIEDLGSSPEWNSGIKAARRIDDVEGKPCWLLDGTFGEMPLVVDEVRPPSYLRTRIAPGAELGFEGTWTYELAPEGAGSTLTLTERGSVASPLFRGLGALFFDHHTTMNALLRDLGRAFGEEVVPEAVALDET